MKSLSVCAELCHETRHDQANQKNVKNEKEVKFAFSYATFTQWWFFQIEEFMQHCKITFQSLYFIFNKFTV